MKYLFAFLIIIHGLIHLIGFAKAFGYAQISQLTKEIMKPVGVLWLMSALILISAGFYILKKEYWWLTALVGALLSQLLIIFYWQDAKPGTLVNLIIFIVALPAFAEWRFETQYRSDVKKNLIQPPRDSLLTLESIAQLPEPVQRYIIYTGAINKPIPKNFKIRFDGQIRKDAQSQWMSFTTEQYNFIDKPTRLFFMKATMRGLPVSGYHAFQNSEASMDIRLLSLFTVQYQDGKEMDISETVTWFNDLCLFAPAALIDKRITWESINSLSAKAIFTYQNQYISATLHFNEKGELINFISDDRYRIANKEDIHLRRFSTPAKEYSEINGYLIPSYGETIWSLPDGDLTYGQFHCREIQYNIESLQ
jgi:hypothetical protein